MKNSKLTYFIVLIFISSSILIYSFSKSSNTPNYAINNSAGFTQDEIAKGLKEALSVGTDSAVKRLAKMDGFYKDAALKILLPPEAKDIIKYKDKVPGLAPLVKEMELRLNRSAEDAVVTAAPIFKDAIVKMTITDGINILKGNKNAATLYLKGKTSSQLVTAFSPKVKTSLDKPLVGNLSASGSWLKITTLWNKYAGSTAGQILGVKKVNSDLTNYVTTKAVSGIFVKVEEQEAKIRTNLNYQVTDLLQKLF